MQHAGAVQCDQAGRQLGEHRAEPLDGQDVGSDELEELTSLHELHREVPFVPFAEQLVQPDEVWMDDPEQRAEFPFEAIDGAGIGPTQGLEGDDLVANAVEGLVDHAHAAGTKASLDLESLGAVEPAGVAVEERRPHTASWRGAATPLSVFRSSAPPGPR